MMDLTVECEALGIPIEMPLDAPPSVSRQPILNSSDLEGLEIPDPPVSGRMPVFLEVVRYLKHGFPELLVGAYGIGPFTLAGELAGVESLSLLLYQDPGLARRILGFSARVSETYLKAQLEAGAGMLVILEPSAVLLSPRLFQDFCLPLLRKIIATLAGPVILHICGDTDHLLPAMAATGAQGLSLDARVDLLEAVRVVPPETVLVGNLHPVEVMVELAPRQVEEKTQDLLRRMQGIENFILSSGCDLPAETPIANIQAMIAACRKT
jgi:uroporphyrinogen decarboxylase